MSETSRNYTNTIQIKRGDSKPEDEEGNCLLERFELGWDKAHKALYIGDVVEEDGVEKVRARNVGGGIIVSDEEPEGNPFMLWIDTAEGGIAKYWKVDPDTEEGEWTTVKQVWA